MIMDQKINDLYKEYTTGRMDRREFFKKLAVLTGGSAAAIALLPLLENNHANADMVAEDDPQLHTDLIKYPGATGDVRAYMARPKGMDKVPGVIIIQENKGLQPHIKDVARRMAKEGFLSIAPDALSPLGGTPEDVNQARSLMRNLDNQSTIKNFSAAVQYLKTNPLTTGKVGCTGFCWGGGMTNQVAVNSPDLSAAVPYYGRQPEAQDVAKIKASVLAHYAGNDARVNSGIAAFEEALKKASVDYRIFIYEGASHGFNNDTNTSRYHKEAAQLAWKRTVAFFKEKLKT
jgi:carboxymethylenebutenolidase